MPQAWKTEDHRVHGCQSTVHLVLRRDPDDAERVQFVAESDSALVQGLIGLLQRVFSGQRAGDVLGFDVERFFTKLGLEQHLTMGRRNGLHAMVGRLRTLAGEQEPA
jgi:cysteine desulfurase/selenocysteine lyase